MAEFNPDPERSEGEGSIYAITYTTERSVSYLAEFNPERGQKPSEGSILRHNLHD